MIIFYICSYFYATILCLITIPILRKVKLYDVPNSRSNHDAPILRGGGIALIITFLSFITLYTGTKYFNMYIVPLIILSILCFLDDLANLKQVTRIITQLFISIYCVYFINDYLRFDNTTHRFILLSLYILIIVSYINIFNFMDGINGISSFQGFITSNASIIFIYSNEGVINNNSILFFLLISSCCLAFLPFNFPSATMFLGDIGSAGLGYTIMFANILCAVEHNYEYLIPLLLLQSNYILDTSITLLNRIRNKEIWYEAHSKHFYQRLVRSGWSHMKVNLLMSITLIVTAIVILLFYNGGIYQKSFTGVFVICLWLKLYSHINKIVQKVCKEM